MQRKHWSGKYDNIAEFFSSQKLGGNACKISLDPSMPRYLEWLSINWAEYFAEEQLQPTSSSSWTPISPSSWTSDWHQHEWKDSAWSEKWVRCFGAENYQVSLVYIGKGDLLRSRLVVNNTKKSERSHGCRRSLQVHSTTGSSTHDLQPDDVHWTTHTQADDPEDDAGTSVSDKKHMLLGRCSDLRTHHVWMLAPHGQRLIHVITVTTSASSQCSTTGTFIPL